MDRNEMPISVVVISYNSATTIVETLNSIKEQTYEKLELIVSDDCSTDNTVSIVKRWFRDNGTRFIKCTCITSKENTGVAGNLNRGIEACSFNYYKTIAADDMLVPKAIEIYMDYFRKQPDAIYVSDVQLLFEQGCTLEYQNELKKQINYLYQRFKINHKDNKKLYKEMLKDNCFPAIGVGILKKEMFLSKGSYDLRFPLLEDYPYYLQLVKEGIAIVYIPRPLFIYRIHQKSISHTKSINWKYEQNKRKFFFQCKWKELLSQGMYKELLLQLYANIRMYMEAKWQSK